MRPQRALERKTEDMRIELVVKLDKNVPTDADGWQDCCGISAQQWAYAAKYSDYLDWAIALETNKQTNLKSEAKVEA